MDIYSLYRSTKCRKSTSICNIHHRYRLDKCLKVTQEALESPLYLEANSIIPNITRILLRWRYRGNIIAKANSCKSYYWKINSVEDRPLLDFDKSNARKHKCEHKANKDVGQRDDGRYTLVFPATLVGLNDTLELVAARSKTFVDDFGDDRKKIGFWGSKLELQAF